jgi:colanic acid/amylovoran biosynthesis glycosyltransferase
MFSFDVFSIREYFPSDECPSVSTWVFNQAKEIQKHGINPLVLSPTPKVPYLIKKLKSKKHAWKIKPSVVVKKYKGVNVIRPAYLKLPGKYFLDYNLRHFSNCLSSVAQDFEAKLIHAHFGHAGIAALNLKNKRKLPLITSFYGYDLGSDKKRLAKYYQRLFNEGDLFLVLSEDMKKDLIEMGFPENKTIIHRLGIDFNNFCPDDNINKNKFIFTVVATFEERKGIIYTIEAYKFFTRKNSIKNCSLRIVGDCRFDFNMKKTTKNDEDIVFIDSFVNENPRELILKEMQYCDVFVLTSITSSDKDKEGTPVVLMEAQSCGKPCISTIHAGIPEVVIDNKTGILVQEKDVKGIADAMLDLYCDKEKRIRFGVNARDQVSKYYNNEFQIPELSKIYKSFF